MIHRECENLRSQGLRDTKTHTINLCDKGHISSPIGLEIGPVIGHLISCFGDLV